MNNPLPTGVKIEYNEEKKIAVILGTFTMSDNTTLEFMNMNDEQVIEALSLATRVGRELETKGYKVKY
jgi:hypothetical protein